MDIFNIVIGMAIYICPILLGIINVVVCLLNRKIKYNLIYVTLSIIIATFQIILIDNFVFVGNTGALLTGSKQPSIIEKLLYITPIIQIFMFIKVIINIKNNKKKEENPNV